MRLALAALAFAIVTAITSLIAHPRMFTGFSQYDDEGYMLTALQGFVDHGRLYDEVFTQYGPFYFEAWGGLFSLFGIPITHEGGRAVTLVAWIVSSLALGLATLRLTGSLLLGLATQMLVFSALGVLTNEPMHPGGIICLLLATIVVVSCFVRERAAPLATALLGGAVAALVLVKINVGVFALVSLALACVVSYPLLAERRWARPLAEAGFVLLPVLLMLGKFDEAWPRRYAVHVAVAALAVVVILRARRAERRSDRELGWLLAGFTAVVAACCLVLLAAGTSLGGLLDGVVGQPLRQADAFTIPLQLSSRLLGVDLLALGAAIAYWYVIRNRSGEPSPAWIAVISLFSVGVGIAIALSLAGSLFPYLTGEFGGYQFTMLAFCWVALIVPGGPRRPEVSFPLLLLPLLAVAQALHAFPVAGSQTFWSTFLLIPVGAICVSNGVRGLAAVVPEGAERRAFAACAAIGAVVLGGVIVNTTLREPLSGSRDSYDAAVPLALPGAEDIRVERATADLYRGITEAIDDNCAALVMLPGMDSFYVWTDQEPPTQRNATGWPTLFDDDRQREAIADVRSVDGLCQLRNIPLATGWSNGEIPPGPLVRYLERGFTLLARFGDYELLRREGSPSS